MSNWRGPLAYLACFIGVCGHASSEFVAKGAPENDAVAAISGIYEAGFENLKKMFGG